jgi:hypothetical protein
MSYYVPEMSYDCFYKLRDLYDFKNYDYGDEELNEYAKTLKDYWFMSLGKKWYKGFSDFVNFYIGDRHLCTINHYVFSRENKDGFQLVIKDIKYKYIQGATPEEYAEYIFNNVLTPERLIPRLAKLLKEKLEKDKELKIKQEELKKQKEKEEYPYHPERWSSEERIEKFVEEMWEYNNDTSGYSDSMADFRYHCALASSVSRIEKAMSDDEFKEAADIYKKKYKHNIKDKLVSFN